jgi:thiol-disulfide isomerase/thioredoxin
MKSTIKNILAAVISLIVLNTAVAQQDPVILSGTFTEKVNAELQLFRTVNNKLQRLGEYNINPSNPEFVFALPADTTITYSFQVTIMKQGHIRLEADKWFSIPLTMKPGQNYSLKITPSKLSSEKKTGFELKTDTRKSSIAFVSGKFVNWNYNANVTIQRVVDGGLEKINSISNSKEKSFLLPCVVKEEGFYYLNSPRWILRVYLKPADKLELAIDGMSGSYEVINGSEENKLMQKWQQLISPITNYGYNSLSIQKDSFDLNSYLNTYESLESSIVNFRNNIDHTGPRFSKLFKMAIDVDKELAPVLFLFNSSAKTINGFRTTPKNFNNVPSFYNRFIHAGKFNDASILNIGEGRSCMNLYTKLVIAALPEEKRKQLSLSEMLGLKINAISNDTLKSYFLKDQMSEIEVNNLTEFRSTFEPYKKYTKPAAVKKKYMDVYNQFSSDTAYVGKSSYNFSLPDSTGRMISMKDFKGKVVFVDVWATWCGPCREQFPFLKEIEEEYKDNNNIVFMGITIDRARDRQKWINTIKKENLPPLQLFDDMGKTFARKYEIVGIPRFLLVSKDGKWIEVRCPRPEAKEELKRYLDKALQGNSLTIKN